MNIINNFILGTAQFGSNYGVGSLKGNLYDSNKSIKLLQNAYKMGIRSLDTAPSYGNACEIILNFIDIIPKNEFNIYSKVTEENLDGDFKQIQRLLQKEKFKKITILMHKEKEISNSDFAKEINNFCKKNDDCTWGVSVYNETYAFQALDLNGCKTIQFPYNIFNPLFLQNGFINLAKTMKVNLIPRSIFVQGLIFKKAKFFSCYKKEVKKVVNDLNKFALKHDLNLASLACLFVRKTAGLDNLLIGVDSIRQLKEIKKIEIENEIDTENLFRSCLESSKSWDYNKFRPELWN